MSQAFPSHRTSALTPSSSPGLFASSGSSLFEPSTCSCIMSSELKSRTCAFGYEQNGQIQEGGHARASKVDRHRGAVCFSRRMCECTDAADGQFGQVKRQGRDGEQKRARACGNVVS